MVEILRTENLSKRFGGLYACSNVNFSLSEGAIKCIIGPNGAGKTTFISLLSGHQQQSEGSIWYKDDEISRMSVFERARKGIARKFQTPALFEELTVYENIELAVIGAKHFHRKRYSRIMDVLEMIRLTDEIGTLANRLPHGKRQWLEIGLLIANDAKILLLDEPTAGMTAEGTASTARIIYDLIEELGLSTIIIEHDIKFIRDLHAPVTVLHMGKILAEGSFDEISQNDQVLEVYLGNQTDDSER
jgi:ABC-type uncharacterized transport system ATPase subunit